MIVDQVIVAADFTLEDWEIRKKFIIPSEKFIVSHLAVRLQGTITESTPKASANKTNTATLGLDEDEVCSLSYLILSYKYINFPILHIKIQVHCHRDYSIHLAQQLPIWRFIRFASFCMCAQLGAVSYF